MSTPRRLGDLPVDDFLNDPARKQSFVTPMFDTIAPRYDAFTRMFSFGMDAGWKRDVIEAVVEFAPAAMSALDLACGTADLAVGVAERLMNIRVVGIDASPNMVRAASERLERMAARESDGLTSGNVAVRDVASRVHVTIGDMMALDVRANSVDLITVGYGVRNVPDARKSVQEMARLLKPGGVLVTLDFYRPQFSPWRRAFLSYLSLTGNAVGWWWHRDPVVYGYIARSIDHFMSWQQFSGLLESEGFRVMRVERHVGGAIAMHVATRHGV